MNNSLKFAGILFFGIATVFYRLFVLTKIWGYVAVKMFGLPQIGMWQVFAISCLLGAFTYESKEENDDKKDEEKVAKLMLSAIITPSVYWLGCYLLFG